MTDSLKYISTRGGAPALGFEDVLLAGLARDGGLYVPEAWPRFDNQDFESLIGRPYTEVAARVMAPYVAGAFREREFTRLVEESYRAFDDSEVAPLEPLGENEHLLELFHGPTLAFKDYALQIVGRLFERVLQKRGERVTIVGATSGDTGSAAIAACAGREAMDIFILHPKGRVSDVQRRQMTTVDAPNVHNLAIDGNFDDCQDLVKALFGDEGLRGEVTLSAVNSINWARIMAQIVYYVWAALRLGLPPHGVTFAVPTGNFGNVYAGYAARQMNLPVAQLIVGSNRNDILTRFFDTGEMTVQEVSPTLSPSMDIQISSNFERYLFELYERDGAAVGELMKNFRETGRLVVEEEKLDQTLQLFDGARFSDDETVDVIRRVYHEAGLLIDPHTAIGIAAGRERRRDTRSPLVALATAHPAKFPEAVERAVGARPDLPPRLADLYERPEHMTELPNDFEAVREHIREHAGKPRS